VVNVVVVLLASGIMNLVEPDPRVELVVILVVPAERQDPRIEFVAMPPF
jgi:hypothetical protein